MQDQTIPSGWMHAKISDIAIKGMQRKPEPSESFTYIDIGSIDRNLKRISAPQVIDGGEAPSRARKIIENGDVLVSLTRPNLNAVALVSQKYHKQIASTGFEVIKPVLVDSRYIFALVRSKEFVDQISGVVQGALYPAAKSSDVQNFEFLLPPLAEQKVIADKLDILLAQVENTKARLERIPQILKRFRQSVLAAAVSGRLTEEWRLADGRKLGPSKEIGDVAKVVRGGSPRPAGHPDYFGGDIPWITVKEITKDKEKFLRATSNKVTELGKSRSRYIEYGTLLLTNSGATLGVPKITKIAGCINDGIVAIQGIEEPLKSYFYYCLLSMTETLRGLNQGAAQPNLNTSIVKAIEVILPSPDEQTEIVRRVDQLFAHADRIEQQVNQALARVNNLTQSILAKAFRGELTEQWRKDNPELISGENSAEALLARIEKERAAQKIAQTKQKSTQYKVKTEITTMRLFENAEITLSELLKELGGETDAHTLWKKSNLSIDDFYAKLKKEKIIVDDNESADPSLRKLKIKEQ